MKISGIKLYLIFFLFSCILGLLLILLMIFPEKYTQLEFVKSHNVRLLYDRLAISLSLGDNTVEPDREPTLTVMGDKINIDYSLCPPQEAPVVVKERPHCPSLFIIGTRKGGTTSLIQYLSKHPSFKGPRLDKGPFSGETGYFHKSFTTKSWQAYLSYYSNESINQNMTIGESSVIYSTSCIARKNIHKSCGTKAKIVYLLRNPYKRLISNYLFRVRIGFKAAYNFTASFIKDWKFLMKALTAKGVVTDSTLDIDTIPELIQRIGCIPPPGRTRPNMFYEGLYLIHLSQWLCHWPAENVMIVNSEEFFESPGKIINQIIDFIGIDKMDSETLKNITSSAYNKGVGKAYFSREERELIQRLYEPFNTKLLEMLGWSSVDWSIDA